MLDFQRGKSAVGFRVALGGLTCDLVGKRGRRWFLIPTLVCKPIPYELFIEAGLRTAWLEFFHIPESARIRGQQLIDQSQFTVDDSKFHLGIGQDYAPFQGEVPGESVNPFTGVG